MPTGCSLNIMMKAMPKRAFDVGIAEQHAVTFSAGLATQGMLPFCNIYSSFMQRAYDQVLHDVALQNLNVVFCLDRAGLVGADGATHQSIRPGLHEVYSKHDDICTNERRRAEKYDVTSQLENKGPFVIRYPRGKGVMTDWKKPMKNISWQGQTIDEWN